MNRLTQVTSACARVVARDEAQVTRAFLKDEAEVRAHARRLHAHMGLLCVSVVAISMMVTSDISELSIFCVTWLITGCQEYMDWLGLM